MKRLYGIFLLFCLSVPVAGTYIWLSYQKISIKRAVQQALLEGIHPSQLVRLAFSPSQADTQLRWEHAREFEYQNQMYDVVKQEPHQDSIIYWCWWDQEETLINHELDALLKKALDNDSESRDIENELSQFFQLLYYVSPTILCALQLKNVAFVSQKVRQETPSLYLSFTFEPPSPPPKQA